MQNQGLNYFWKGVGVLPIIQRPKYENYSVTPWLMWPEMIIIIIIIIILVIAYLLEKNNNRHF